MKNKWFSFKVWLFWLIEIRLYPSSEKWSNKLEYLIDEGFIFEKIDDFRATIGDELVWIANCPYASFRRCNKGDFFNSAATYMPNKRVGYMCVKLLRKSIAIQNNKQLKKFESQI